MPAFNESHWRQEKYSRSTWSGDRWLDWEHGTVVRRALRRIWPLSPHEGVVWDVGAGDRLWSAWMKKTFDPAMLLAIEPESSWPNRAPSIPYVTNDAEHLTAVQAKRPDLVVFLNSLAYMADWKKALTEALAVSRVFVLVFDNLQTPTPPWRMQMPHGVHIESNELVDFAVSREAKLKVAGVAGDWWHRRLFLRTPEVLHPAVAVSTAALDFWAAYTRSPRSARHSAWLFRKPI